MHRMLVRGLVGAERHVDDHVRTVRPAHDRGAVPLHVDEIDGRRARVPEDVVSERVADQENVDAGGFGETGERRIVRGDDRKRRAFALGDR